MRQANTTTNTSVNMLSHPHNKYLGTHNRYFSFNHIPRQHIHKFMYSHKYISKQTDTGTQSYIHIHKYKTVTHHRLQVQNHTHSQELTQERLGPLCTPHRGTHVCTYMLTADLQTLSHCCRDLHPGRHMWPHTESQTHPFKDALPSLPWPHIPDIIYNPRYWGYDHTLTGETWRLEGGQDLKLNPVFPRP